jgi:hypothetical protein
MSTSHVSSMVGNESLQSSTPSISLSTRELIVQRYQTSGGGSSGGKQKSMELFETGSTNDSGQLGLSYTIVNEVDVSPMMNSC